jgi:hypothetical protein
MSQSEPSVPSANEQESPGELLPNVSPRLEASFRVRQPFVSSGVAGAQG